ncbi:MAG: class I adenylate-forming enzyme family protein, partial [Acidobacteriota bacterium]
MSQKESYWLNKTLPQLLRENAEKAADGPAVMWDGQVMNWGQLNLLSDQLAAGLAKLGISRGDVVSCQLGNVHEFLILHHAVAKCRAIFNPIHLPYRSSELEHILDFSESSMLVVGPSIKEFSYMELGLQMKQRLECLQHLVSVGEETAVGAIPFESLKLESAPSLSEPDPEDPFLMLFTSGTTASPKATVHTHNMRLTNSWFCGADFALREADHMLCCSAFSHMWAILNYYSSVIYGCPQVLLQRYRPEEFLTTAAEGEATVVIGAPVHAIDLLASPQLSPSSLSNMRLFALSGTVCPPQLMRQLTDTLPHCKPMVFWGMTETGGGFYTRLEDPPEIVENTAGRASGPCVIRVLDEEGRQLAPGEEGE